jgi:hypothetical protein
MKRFVCVLAALAVSLGTVASAGAENDRFKGCAVETPRAIQCSHEVTGPGLIVLRFTDRQAASTRYKICIKDIVGKQCFHDKTDQKRQKDAFYFEPRAAGEHTVRWKVDGHQVERWDFNLIPAPGPAPQPEPQ